MCEATVGILLLTKELCNELHSLVTIVVHVIYIYVCVCVC